MISTKIIILFLSNFIVLTIFFPSCKNDLSISELKINQIQVLGSHNSYKQAIDPILLAELLEEDSTKIGLDYQHIPLQAQLDIGLRKLELDVYFDPTGGRFAHPLGLRTLENNLNFQKIYYDPENRMQEPGFKILHVQDIDFRSSVYTLKDALEELKKWSDLHPSHLPIAISFNAKSDTIQKPGYTRPLPFKEQTFDSLDNEILQVIPRSRIITPDEVRGNHSSLEEAVTAFNWPTIEAARGRFLFVLDEQGKKMETYVKNHPSLIGRVMFVNAEEGNPEAGFRIVNDPINDFLYIQELVKKGYLVRTRADAETREARTGDYSRFEKALDSGAHYISTDYYLPDKRLNTGYQIRLPKNEIARLNPVLVGKSDNVLLWE
jgi:hypothetical protein